MIGARSKRALLYDEVRLALQTGRYAPGDRIDPASLAVEFKTSTTPVRYALYRLVGEGVIDDDAREGFHVPLPTELGLRDQYDWMQRLLLMACDMDSAPKPGEPANLDVSESGPRTDIAVITARLFERIAAATQHLSLFRAMRQANDRLGPTRWFKQGLIQDAPEELAALYQCWQRRDTDALKSAVIAYHERRKQHVPQIVALVSGAVPDVRD